MTKERDLNAPLSESERYLLAKLFRATGEIPPEFWAALKSKLEIDPPKLLASDMPNLKGEEWREVTAFGTNWGNLGGAVATAAFMKDVLGWVHLKGGLTKSGTPAAGDVLFTLPEGYRPEKEEYFPTATFGATHAAGTVRVETDGDVVWLAGITTETDCTSLSGINFRARAA